MAKKSVEEEETMKLEINKKKVNSVQEYLKTMVKWQKTRPRPKGWKYSCIEDFILQNGRKMELKSFPKKFKRGKMKECFRNAFTLADMNDLVYCEGIAFSIIPTLHAWCLHEGKVIDPTWKDGEDYFGVKLPLEIVRKIILKKGTFGIIDSWEIGHPLISGKIVI